MNATAPKERPDIAIFPDLNIAIRTPAGREYRGKVLQHPSQHAEGETWLQVQFLEGVSKDDAHSAALLKQQHRKSGLPDYFAPESKVEPLDVTFNRIPTAKRTDRNADTLIGELWDADGLWTVLIKPSKAARVLYAGSVLPAAAEIAFAHSKISQHQRPARPDDGEIPPESARGPRVAG